MSWNDNEGPWGSSKDKKPASQNPWARKTTGGGNDKPPGNGQKPPEFDEVLNWLRSVLGPFKPSGHFHAVVIGFIGLVFIWMLSGFYQVAPDEVGVVMRFGAFERTETPGLHYHLPSPVEVVTKQVVTSQNEIQIGFDSTASRSRGILNESMMLTEDENIVNVQFSVFWRVNDIADFLFEVRSPNETIRMAAESVIREVIGQNKLQFALTEGRSQIAEETRKRLQALMDEYKMGVIITQINLQNVSVPEEVRQAFQDVIDARLDRESMQNKAAEYVNKVIPEAKGQAAALLEQAKGYRDQKIAIAQGEADRFKSVLAAYEISRDVTPKRLYLEMMEDVLGDAQKVLVDKSAFGGSIPSFPLQQMLNATGKSGSAGDKQ